MGQPLCIALQIAIVDLLSSWQLNLVAVTGHTSGEIAAAYCVECLSHESAINVAFYQDLLAGRLEKRGCEQGAMTSIGRSGSAITPFISEVNSDPER